MKKFVLAALLLGYAAAGYAKPAFTGKDYSGIYSCDGWNALVGDYDVIVTLKFNRLSSYGKYGAYEYETETANSKYLGQAISNGGHLSIGYKFNGKSINGRGQSIGIAEIFKNKQGRWTFHTRYYEPDDNGGNYGSEYCTFKEPLPQPEKKSFSGSQPSQPKPQ
jgi:hypothetical protein